MAAKECGKQRFPTKTRAMTAARRVPPDKAGRVPLKAYWCAPCKSWHYSSKPPYRGRKS